MAPQYGISKFGRPIIISEDHPSNLRKIFVSVTLIVGTIAILNAIGLYFRVRKRQNRQGTPFLVNVTYLVFILNITIHTAHYADNIWRPVDYYEPKYLYDKYIFETMEITFFANFPILLLGSKGMACLFSFHKDKLVINRSGCYWVFGFIIGSLLTVMHYRVEPPSSYSVVVNLTIAGEGVVTIILAALMAVCLRSATSDKHEEVIKGNIEMESLLEEEPEIALGSAMRRSPRRKR